MESVKTNSLCLPFSRLSVVDTLGRGTFGSVQLVKEKTKGGVAALKTIPKESISKYMIEIQKQNVYGDNENNNKTLGTQALKEITAMKRVCTGQCSGIPRYVGDREDKDNYYILMDSVKGKSLRTIINEMGPFTDINAVRSILAQILSTISFIHSQNVLHRDLSDNNILIQPNGTVKIIDFGCATIFDPNSIPDCSPYTEYPEIDPDDINKNNIIGTLDFIAPEVLVDNYYSEKSDIWSFGVLLFFMVTGHYPFSDDEIDDVYETMYNILENTVIFYDDDEIYEPLYDIFYLCCNPDIHTRISIEELKNHEFFEGIDWNVITMPKNKKKPNLSIHTSLLKNNANAAFMKNSSTNNNMGPNQIYMASPTCLNSPLRINSPSCLYTPMPCGYNTPVERNESPILTSNSSMVNSPIIKSANPLFVSSSPLVKSANAVVTSPKIRSAIATSPKIKSSIVTSPKIKSSMVTSPKIKSSIVTSPKIKSSIVTSPKIKSSIITSPKIRPTSPTVDLNSDFQNETYIFSPKAIRQSNINNINNILNKHNNNLSTNKNIINNITPKKPMHNRTFLNEEYINSPLQQSILFSQNAETQNLIKNPLYQSTPSPIIFNSSSPKEINDEFNLNNSNKRKNILFSNNDHKTLSSSLPYKSLNLSENSDDETKSNCTLTNESEKEYNSQSPLIEDKTLILNDIDINNPNSDIYKTWDSEHSHVLTF